MSEKTVEERLASIEAKLDLALSHEPRISALERWQAGIVAVLTFVVATVGLALAAWKR